ncbi:hypothetical protein O5699_04255 [Escherichia coli]|nr:hypothetical protein [Escherichia coli]
MPTPNNEDKISLVIAGRSHSDWSSYRIDSDFLKAADGWQLQLGLPEKGVPGGYRPGRTNPVAGGRRNGAQWAHRQRAPQCVPSELHAGPVRA